MQIIGYDYLFRNYPQKPKIDVKTGKFEYHQSGVEIEKDRYRDTAGIPQA